MHSRPILQGLAVSFLGAGLMLALSCNTGNPANPGHPVDRTTPKTQNELLAQRISTYGHGLLFDQNLKEIRLSTVSIKAMQEAILTEVLKSQPKPPGAEAKTDIERAMKWLSQDDLQPAEAMLLRSGLTSRWLVTASDRTVALYARRNEALLTYYWNTHPQLVQSVRPEILEALLRLRPWVSTSTRYMDDCRAHRVPIPPDWAETGTAWQAQGTLTQNLLRPGEFAQVWTYSDPAEEGACIALPRGSGAPGSLAGIICQSATTGHACFWDNIRRNGGPEVALGWRGQRLVINQLKDGSNLNSPCTDCHRGNNVYLISPDDPTWGKVLRGPLSGPSTGTFSTRVRASTDNEGGHPRYIPITTVPPRSGWVNTFATGGCAGSCHERPVVSAPPMPPDCARPASGSGPLDPENCYGTP